MNWKNNDLFRGPQIKALVKSEKSTYIHVPTSRKRDVYDCFSGNLSLICFTHSAHVIHEQNL